MIIMIIINNRLLLVAAFLLTINAGYSARDGIRLK